MAKNEVVKCANPDCNNTFEKLPQNKKFCSRTCQVSIANLKLTNELYKTRHCKVCNKMFHPKQYNHVFCSRACSTYSSRSNRLKNIKKYKSWWSKNKCEKIEQLGGKCVKCGYNTDIRAMEIHHILPPSMGGTDDESNLVLLCRNCHAIAHYEINKKGTVVHVIRRDVAVL